MKKYSKRLFKVAMGALFIAGFSAQAISPGEISARGLLEGSPSLKTGDVPVVIRPGVLGSGGAFTNIATAGSVTAVSNLAQSAYNLATTNEADIAILVTGKVDRVDIVQAVTNDAATVGSSAVIYGVNDLAQSAYDLAAAGNKYFYATTNASLVAETVLSARIVPLATSTNLISGITNGQYIAAWITPVGEPGTTEVTAGQRDVVLYARQVSTLPNVQICSLNAELYIVAADGTTLIKEYDISGAFPALTDVIDRYATAVILNVGIPVDVTSRRVIKIKATVTGTGTAPDVELFYGDGTPSNFSTPVTGADVPTVADLALKLDKVGYRYLTVEAGADATVNGTALLAAYVTAEGMTPAANSEVAIILPPATYNLGAGTLAMDTEYINVIGQIPVTVTMQGPVVFGALTGRSAVITGDNPQAIITSSGTAISNTVNNGTVCYVRVNGDVTTSGTKSATWQDVWFAGNVDKELPSSNTFIRVYVPLGICGDPDGTYSGNNNFYGTLESSVVSGYGCLSGNGGTLNGSVNNSTVSGDYCLAGSGTLNGSVNNSTVSGENCLAGGGTLNGSVNNSTVSGYGCLASYGEMRGSVNNSTVSGENCLAGYGTLNGLVFRSDISGPTQMASATYTTNAIISFSTGIDPAITNSVAKVFNSADSSYNLIPNQ